MLLPHPSYINGIVCYALHTVVVIFKRTLRDAFEAYAAIIGVIVFIDQVATVVNVFIKAAAVLEEQLQSRYFNLTFVGGIVDS